MHRISRGKRPINRKLVLVASAAAIGVVAWKTLPPDTVALGDKCLPEGPMMWLSATIYRDTFWSRQREATRREIKVLEEAPARQAKEAAELEESLAQARAAIAEVTANVEIPLSPAQRRAKQLRDQADELNRQADAIEWAALQETLEEFRQQRIVTLKSCEAGINRRLR